MNHPHGAPITIRLMEVRFSMANEFRQMFTAWALSGYSAELNAASSFLRQETPLQAQAAVAAMIKAYSCYSLPILIYDLARLVEVIGYEDRSIELLGRFLEEQDRFDPSVLESESSFMAGQQRDDLAAALIYASQKTLRRSARPDDRQ